MNEREVSDGQTSRRWVPTVAAMATVPAVTGAFIAATAAPASAACSGIEWVEVWTDQHYAAGGTCVDLNFREATEGDYYRGVLDDGNGNWFEGSGGLIWRSGSTTDLRVAHTNTPQGKEYMVVANAIHNLDSKVHVYT